MSNTLENRGLHTLLFAVLAIILALGACTGQADTSETVSPENHPAHDGSSSASDPSPNPVCQQGSADDVADCPTAPTEICAAIGYECGKVFANIGCGGQPELVDCGGCADGYQCIEGSCACPESFECGDVQDSCGGTTSCGSCKGGFACGDDNTCYCEREPDAEICERLGHECGVVEARDFCDSMVTADCGECDSGVCSARSCHEEVVLEPSEVPDAERGARFGTIMAARPGFIAVSARYLDAGSATDAGAVRIFERQRDASWKPAKRLRAPTPTDDGLFGWNVVATDSYLFVSARRTEQGDSAVFVFSADADWQLTQTLRAPEGRANREFGADMSVTPDGRLLVASRPSGDTPAPGRVDIFELNEGSWQAGAAIDAPAALDANARFAQAVTSSEGFVFVSADYAEVDAKSEAGAVYAYLDQAAGLEQVARLVPDDPQGSMWFGHRLAWADGSLLIAAPHDSDQADGSGTVYVFGQDDAGEWVQQQQLHDPEPRNSARFGHDLAALGNHAVVGLWDDESVFLFRKDAESWSLARDIRATDPDPDSWFGYRVTMLDDAVVVGEPKRGSHGAVRLYGFE